MDETGETDVGNVTGRAEDALKVPDGFGAADGQVWSRSSVVVDLRVRVNLVEETTAVLPVKDTSETPWLVLQWLNVLNLNEKNVTRLGGLDLEWTSEVVDLGQVDVFHVVGTVIVANLSAGPVYTLDLDDFVVLDCASSRNCKSQLRNSNWNQPTDHQGASDSVLTLAASTLVTLRPVHLRVDKPVQLQACSSRPWRHI